MIQKFTAEKTLLDRQMLQRKQVPSLQCPGTFKTQPHGQLSEGQEDAVLYPHQQTKFQTGCLMERTQT